MTLSFRTRRRLLVAAALLLLFTLTGFFLLPPILKAQLEQRLSGELGRRVTVQTVRFNPYTAAITLENFTIYERDGSTAAIGWKRLYFNAGMLASIFGQWMVQEISLDGLHGRVAFDAKGEFNFADVLARLARRPPSPTASPGRPLVIRHFQISDAQCVFSDASRPQPFSSSVGPVSFTLRDFRTANGSAGAPYHFDAKTESNERLAWSGTLQASPPRSAGSVRIENIVLKKYAPYYADRFNGEITDGILSLSGNYVLDAGKERKLTLSGGAVHLARLAVFERGTGPAVATVSSLEVKAIEADALAQRGHIGQVAVTGGQLRVRRAADGSINLLALLPPVKSTPDSPATAAPPPSTLTDFSIAEVSVTDTRIELTDEAGARPVNLALDAVNLSLREVSFADGTEIPVQLAFRWAPAGAVRVNGKIGIQPLKGDLRCQVESLELLPLSPYLESLINVRVTQAAASMEMGLRFSLQSDGPHIAAEGAARLQNVGLVDSEFNEELAGIELLAIRGLRAKAAPAVSVVIEEIEAAAPMARAIRYEDGSINLTKVAGTPSNAAASDTPTPAGETAPASQGTAIPPPVPQVEIGRVVIRDGDFRFLDRSISPAVSCAITGFGGATAGLSSSKPGQAEVDLKAVVNGSGAVSIAGRFDPLKSDPSVDLKIAVKHVDLQPFSPYSGRFAGYELARGQLALDLKVAVDGPKINAANVLTLNQFTFGAPVQSPSATTMPVRLGVALLKDTEGRIVIDIPVQGNRDDPEFRVGRVISRVIVNLLTKAATSPFSLLGAAFGGGEELAFQEFAPGTASLQETERAKRETLTKALTQRPSLSVAIEGHFDRAADGYELKRRKLADRVRRSIWEDKRKMNPSIAPPDALTISAQEEAAMIKKLFDETFPPGTKFGTPVPPPPPIQAPPEPPKAWLPRLIGAITFQAQRERRAAERENARRRIEHQEKASAVIAAGLPLDEMRGRLAETITVEDSEFRALSQARAEVVRNYFINEGAIAADRLFLTQQPPASGSQVQGPRVLLHLQ